MRGTLAAPGRMDNPGSRPNIRGMSEYDVAISGGGLNGTSLALALDLAGLRVALIDPVPARVQSDPGFDGRGYALALSSVQVLRALGLWPDLAEHAQPIQEVKVCDSRLGEAPAPLVMELHSGEMDEGPMGHMVEDRRLRPVLNAAVARSGVARVQAKVVGHRPGPGRCVIDLTSAGGGAEPAVPQIQASVLVGAEGVGSATSARAGVRHSGWGYGQTALVCAIAHERPHGGVAHQMFLPNGPLAVLPLTGDRASIVWTETHAAATRIQALGDAEYLAALQARLGGFLGQISLAGDRFTYALSLSLAQSFVAPRVALIGDAAHRVHPIAGQGLNAGLKDVAVLAEVLALAKRRGEDIGRANVLARYQSWRRFDAVALAVATDGFNRLFSNDIPLVRAARDLGLGAVNLVPGLRRRIMREAAGVTGDVPRLMRGLAV